MIIALIVLIIITGFIWFVEHHVEQRRLYEICHERRVGVCKDILIGKKCNKCPYRVKTFSV